MVDPAGMKNIHRDPSTARAASEAVYQWLEITNDPSFPEPVVASINNDNDAKYWAYGDKHCIHVVGPDFKQKPGITRDAAIQDLALSYKNVFWQFVISGKP